MSKKSEEDLIEEAQVKASIYQNESILHAIHENMDVDYQQFLQTMPLFSTGEDLTYINKIEQELNKMREDRIGEDPIEWPRLILYTCAQFQERNELRSKLEHINEEKNRMRNMISHGMN
ncbi:hypothetical protein TVAG_067850 [Trichomonas vaginalis G3]|uniref:Uncharacterized protein n=1 Tax=Trichomonas vaginalis (strain ATCC PRA-98 / G3) TaxID=412133 RepID=A2EMG9_TRIV3|nr:hypothetical protein TVAGG3_0499180 [Trichomonas vaginalis G3]EAY06125.1 hypothetical protein TVAG_067850 [Trichomonas vaginalis G3]KAI5516948.1 hypothetical protein TVAGG3_0499180 [Trichomonas vaginalis G3]|eukprot:XP_001318348.1 hypothetical protein [Trichomonas vaginalis G3]